MSKKPQQQLANFLKGVEKFKNQPPRFSTGEQLKKAFLGDNNGIKNAASSLRQAADKIGHHLKEAYDYSSTFKTIFDAFYQHNPPSAPDTPKWTLSDDAQTTPASAANGQTGQHKLGTQFINQTLEGNPPTYTDNHQQAQPLSTRRAVLDAVLTALTELPQHRETIKGLVDRYGPLVELLNTVVKEISQRTSIDDPAMEASIHEPTPPPVPPKVPLSTSSEAPPLPPRPGSPKAYMNEVATPDSNAEKVARAAPDTEASVTSLGAQARGTAASGDSRQQPEPTTANSQS